MKKLVFICFLLLFSCTVNNNTKGSSTINTSEVKEEYEVSLVACGDNLIHHTIYKSAYNNGTYNFLSIIENIKPYISNFDLAFINQETILGGEELGLSSYPRFNSPYEIGDAIVDAGFNLISLANNHTLDRGEEAIRNSIKYWQKQDVIYSGSEIENRSHMKLFTKNNIKFAFIAYTYGTNGIPIPKGKDYLVNLFSYEKAKNDIEKVKQDVDVIIVSMHWGNEYHDYPSEKQIEEANFLSQLGVDIIIGHHPHVIQPFDIINDYGTNTYVIYSLGNFLSDQNGIDRLIGMAYSLNIKKSIENNIKIITIDNPVAKLLYTYKNDNKFKIIFFDELNSSILPQYNNYFAKKKELIQKYNKTIKVI